MFLQKKRENRKKSLFVHINAGSFRVLGRHFGLFALSRTDNGKLLTCEKFRVVALIKAYLDRLQEGARFDHNAVACGGFYRRAYGRRGFERLFIGFVLIT